MARIRTIKPEYATDGKIRRLSDSSALFFILLWTQSDDYGFFPCDTLELSLKIPRWRSQSIFKMLCVLAECGLIRVCTKLSVGQIVSWEHQKIRDKRASKWNDMEIQWDEINVNAQGTDRKTLGKEMKGREGRGKESNGDADGACLSIPDIDPQNRTKRTRRKTLDHPSGAPPKKIHSELQEMIIFFKTLWSQKNSGAQYSWLGKDSGLLNSILKANGAARTKFLIEAFLNMPDAWIRQRGYSFTDFHQNIAKVARFADSGDFMTKSEATSIDRTVANLNVFNQLSDELNEREFI